MLLTGIQPSGTITIGNYLGAIKNFKEELSSEKESLIFIADLHALTSLNSQEENYKNTKDLIALYIAMGINKQSTIFLQSSISEHSELAWILQCHSKFGQLDRMTQFKDKSKNNQKLNVGLYTYPTLMAADILLYNTNKVPVGEDQKQHLELTRDIAQSFNSFYKKDIFTIPEPLIKKEGAKIYSLIDPTKKMSKSSDNPKSYISILDTKEKILKKVKSATTDSVGEINYDPENQPGVSNLLTIYSLCEEISMNKTMEFFKGQNYGFLKEQVAEAIIKELEPIQKRYEEVMENSSLIENVLNQGYEKAKKIASTNLENIKKEIGLLNIK